jgi:hypothetical protein
MWGKISEAQIWQTGPLAGEAKIYLSNLPYIPAVTMSGPVPYHLSVSYPTVPVQRLSTTSQYNVSVQRLSTTSQYNVSVQRLIAIIGLIGPSFKPCRHFLQQARNDLNWSINVCRMLCMLLLVNAKWKDDLEAQSRMVTAEAFATPFCKKSLSLISTIETTHPDSARRRYK